MPFVKRLAVHSGISFAVWCAFLQQTVRGADCNLRTECKAGIVLPVWGGEPSTGETVGRAFVYLLALLFMFLGVSIISDRFMSAIEIITSKEKEIKITDKQTGKERVLTVKLWNETVSNLTLMALGSSAPEILLSAIEICGNNFNAGELGPSTIVGSAAFNLLIIIAVCVYVIPDGEVRRIKHLRVFAITASTSVLAYVWLYVILALSSKDEVEIWEAILTFAFFPVMVICAYIADRRLLFYRALRKRQRRQKRGGMTVVQTGDFDIIGVQVKDGFVDGNVGDGRYADTEAGQDFDDDELLHDLTEDRREKAIQALKEIRQNKYHE